MDKTTILNGSGKEFITAALNSQGMKITEEEVENIFSSNTDNGKISEEDVKKSFIDRLGAWDSSDEVFNIIAPFLEYMDSKDSEDDGYFSAYTEYFDLNDVLDIDSDMYEAIVAYESNGTVTSSNKNSSSNTSSSSTSTNASKLNDIIPANPVSYKNLGSASVNYHSEVPDSLRWTGNSTNVNIYSLKDGDSSEKFRKINPEDMRYFSNEYGDDINVNGQEIIAKETGKVIGYWNANEDGTNSFYLKDGITYSSITSYLYQETTENDDNSGSAGEDTKSEDRDAFEKSEEWNDSNHKECSGTKEYFEKKGFTFDGDLVKKDGKTIGVCDKIDDNRVNITIMNDGSDDDIVNLTSGENIVDGVEQGHYECTENADKTVTINIYGAADSKCTITSEATEDGLKLENIQIGGEDLTEDNFKELIENIKDPDTLDALFDSGVLNEVQNLGGMKNGHETEYFKEILSELNKNNGYGKYSDSSDYTSKDDEYSEYKEKIDNGKVGIEDILVACEKGKISVTSALYLLNQLTTDLCSGGESDVGSLEDLFRDMNSDSQEEHISTFLKLIAAANYRTQEDNTEVKNSESADDTKGAAETKEEAAKKDEDEGKTADSGYTCNMTSKAINNLPEDYSFAVADRSICKNDEKVATVKQNDDGICSVEFINQESLEEFMKSSGNECYARATDEASDVTTDIVFVNKKEYTITSNKDGEITNITIKESGESDGETKTKDISDKTEFSEVINEITNNLQNEEIKTQFDDCYGVSVVAYNGDTNEIKNYIEDKTRSDILIGNFLRKYQNNSGNATDFESLIHGKLFMEDKYGIDSAFVDNADYSNCEDARHALERVYSLYDNTNDSIKKDEAADVILWLNGGYNESDFNNLAAIINSFDSSEDREKYLKFVCDILGETEDE